MNRNLTDEYGDAILNDSISEAEQDNPTGEDELRLARIRDYRSEALQRDKSDRANVGAVTAGLHKIAALYEPAVITLLQVPSGNILECPQVQRGMNTLLNLTRQIERFANLELRLDEADKQEEKAKSQRRRGIH